MNIQSLKPKVTFCHPFQQFGWEEKNHKIETSQHNIGCISDAQTTA